MNILMSIYYNAIYIWNVIWNIVESGVKLHNPNPWNVINKPIWIFRALYGIISISVSEWAIFSYIIQWDDDDIHFVLDVEFHLYSVRNQQLAGRHIAPLGHIVLILSQPVFVLTPYCCVLNTEKQLIPML